ncbi:DUF2946 family protein [Arenibacterium sp. CAU 1754]
MGSAVLLLALCLSGIVPEGMMRTVDADGTRLVLCTGEGPREIWMAADGSISDQEPSHEEQAEVAECLAVSLSLAAVQNVASGLYSAAEFSAFVPEFQPAPSHVQGAWPPSHPRAPPLFSGQ